MENEIRYDEERIGTIFSDIQMYIRDFEGLGIHRTRTFVINAISMHHP
jgi:hypothetical protein